MLPAAAKLRVRTGRSFPYTSYPASHDLVEFLRRHGVRFDTKVYVHGRHGADEPERNRRLEGHKPGTALIAFQAI
jgi:hypothetical protein